MQGREKSALLSSTYLRRREIVKIHQEINCGRSAPVKATKEYRLKQEGVRRPSREMGLGRGPKTLGKRSRGRE